MYVQRKAHIGTAFKVSLIVATLLRELKVWAGLLSGGSIAGRATVAPGMAVVGASDWVRQYHSRAWQHFVCMLHTIRVQLS